MATKLTLLKLSKKELIKKCKKYKLNTNGNKKDMIDRLLKNKSFLKHQNKTQSQVIDTTPNVQPKSKSKLQRKKQSNKNVFSKSNIANWLKVPSITSSGKSWIGLLTKIYNGPYIYEDELFLKLLNEYYPDHNNDKYKNKILPFHDFDCSDFSYCSFAIDIDNNMIYAPFRYGMYKYNIFTNKLNTKKVSFDRGEELGWNNHSNTQPTCVKIDNKLHIFGLYNDNYKYGNDHNVHQIYNIDTDEIELEEMDQINSTEYCGYDFSMVHVRSQNKLLFATGKFSNKDKIIEYNLTRNTWHLRGNLEKGKDVEDACMLITKDEKYVLILNIYKIFLYPQCVSLYNDNIEIYDTEKMSLRKSKRKLPKYMYVRDKECSIWDFKFKVFIFDESDLIIIGYLRQIGVEIPFELVNMISTFFYKEYVHLIKTKTDEHWKISVDSILGES